MGQNLDSKGYLMPGPRDDLKPLLQDLLYPLHILDYYGNPVEIESIWENCSGLFVKIQIQYDEEWDKI